MQNDNVSAFNPDSLVLTPKLPMCQLELIENSWQLTAKTTAGICRVHLWVAANDCKMGAPIDGSFVLDPPNIQTFERKPKEPQPSAASATRVIFAIALIVDLFGRTF
ncbi:MAG: hypothetical protein KME25_33925 [Symplocastrum torsivum CPER-KK1]|uniref:Uncharacterized protein n=1 Tax=Symplocastrum torsivum CPER-KK1 TaxID=450513 RepID=A0A951PT96_9CYAN|nr:hypothetical protein [Symplocastrum torsivum CPER-KK1]